MNQRRFIAIVILLTLLVPLTSSFDPARRALGVSSQDTAFVVRGIEFEYVKPLSGLPDPLSFFDIEIELTPVDGGFRSPQEDAETTRLTIGDIGRDGAVTLDRGAIDVVCQAVAETYPSFGLFVAPSEDDVDPFTGQDLRAADRQTLRIRVGYEGPSYPISRFVLHYAIGDHPGQTPTTQILANVTVILTPSDDGYVTWRPGVTPVPVTLSNLDGRGPQQFSAISVQMVLEAISDYLVSQGFMGVWARPAPGELGVNLSDARQDRTDFHIEIVTGFVSAIRTVARGDRIEREESINNPLHEKIRAGSPVQPTAAGEVGPQSILKRDELDRFLFRLSRHPGRRVDAAVAPGVDPFSISLDYQVIENKEVTLYTQAANSGTTQTREWRYRIGLYDNQFTGNDDILSLEFVTADFEDNYVVSLSYEAPVEDDDHLRWRAYGLWSEFAASEVGFASEQFTGESWVIGAELIRNIHQDKQLFVDVIVGLRFTNIKVNNPVVFVSGDQDFLLPYIGVHVEKDTAEATTDFLATLEWNPSFVTGTDEPELNTLGRLFPDNNWLLLRWNAVHSFFLEPVLNPEAWADISTPASSTLAHELALRFRGQYSFEHRLIPQMEQVAGGALSVRGYPESVAVGDTVLMATAEYRYHVPRAFGFQEETANLFNEPFRVVPQQPYGAADWDLVLRGFVDIGRTINTKRRSFETDETLVGAGIGLEFVFKSNLNVRLDWGFALEGIQGQVDEGSSQVHFVGTIFF